jgi:hypothetical protein
VGLLRACRHIHIETTGLFYSLNVFRLNNNMDLLTLTVCLSEEKRSVIRRIDLRLRAAKAIESRVLTDGDCAKMRLFPALEAVHVWGRATESRKSCINKSLTVATDKMDLSIVWEDVQYGEWEERSCWAGGGDCGDY